ncbi:MAG: LysM peptidoglycan-binding domain-containing protein [Kiritimatiellales bacterium]
MKNFIFVVLIAIGLTGCETMPFEVQTRVDRAAMSQDQLIAQESQRRMAGRLESLEMQMGQMNRDLDTLKGQLSTRCAAIEQKSEADKREMVTRLSGELDKLMKQASASKPAVATTATGRGIEHAVQPGETLYIIAKAYNVSAKTIIDSNKIQEPGRLSVGQKLFIPQ